jgi:hypothetical protein
VKERNNPEIRQESRRRHIIEAKILFYYLMQEFI